MIQGKQSPKELAGVNIIVAGLVQGVFFRASTQKIATQLALKGWVKNLPNGSVELEAHGLKSSVEELISFLRVGPSGSRVDNLDIKPINYSHKYVAFEIL